MPRSWRLPISLGLGGSLTWVLLNPLPETGAILWGILFALLHTFFWEIADIWTEIVYISARGLPYVYRAIQFLGNAARRLAHPALSDTIILGVGIVQIFTYIKFFELGNELLNRITFDQFAHLQFFVFAGALVLSSFGHLAVFGFFSLKARRIVLPVDFWFWTIAMNPFVFSALTVVTMIGAIFYATGLLSYKGWQVRHVPVKWGVSLGHIALKETFQGLIFAKTLSWQTLIFLGRLARNAWFYIERDELRTCFIYSLGLCYTVAQTKGSIEISFVEGLLLSFFMGLGVGGLHNLLKDRYRIFFSNLLALVR